MPLAVFICCHHRPLPVSPLPFMALFILSRGVSWRRHSGSSSGARHRPMKYSVNREASHLKFSLRGSGGLSRQSRG